MEIQDSKNVITSKQVLVDRELGRFLSDFFSMWHHVEKNNRVLSQEKYKFTAIDKDKILTYSFSASVIKNIKAQLNRQEENTKLSMGQLAWKVFLAMLLITHDNQKKSSDQFSGHFTYSEIAKLLDLKKGGRQYEQIRSAFLGLASATISISSQTKLPKATKNKLEMFHFLDKSGIEEIRDEKGLLKETTFTYKLNSEGLGLCLLWIQNGSVTSKEITAAGGYLPVPVKSLKKKRSAEYENFLLRLKLWGEKSEKINHGAWVENRITGKIKVKTIFTDWLKLTDDQLRRRAYCKKMIEEFFAKAKEDDEFGGYKLSYRLHLQDTSRQWKDNWSVTVTKIKAAPIIHKKTP